MEINEAIMRLEAHEKECAVRYEAIQRQLDKADQRFDRIERLMLQGFGMMGTSIILAIALLEFLR